MGTQRRPEEFDPRVIRVAGARDHNLRDVSLTLPKNRLICFTGVSGSGKSTLAFDTLYAEGQRRYVESLSSYARQFMGQLPKPDVDQITGLSPSISIQQKSTGWNPRSTVGTITQIHDYLRVLYARVGSPHCPRCGRPISAQSREQMLAAILALPAGTRFLLLAPVVRAQKGEHRDLFEDLTRDGFVRARVDGEVVELASPPALDKNRRHDVEVVVDRLQVAPGLRTRLADALDTALAVGKGLALVVPAGDGVPAFAAMLLSAHYACAECNLGFEPPHPQSFSFNSPQGMCLHCDGLGTRFDFDADLLVPDASLRIVDPCIVPLRHKPGRWRRHIYEGVARHFGFDLDRPWRELPASARKVLLFGAGDAHITFEWRTRHGVWKHGGRFEGVIAELQARYRKSSSTRVRAYYEQFMRQAVCAECRGGRLNPQAQAVTLSGRLAGTSATAQLNLPQLCELPVQRALEFLGGLELTPTARLIAAEPLKEVHARLRFLLDVGLDYLTLARPAPSLSGGESQRIRLASQIGCGLVGVLYVLDEPSIGLHPRDNRRLLASLRRLRDMGNTVVVVEHDEETMRAADHLVDFGPGPGLRGGRVVAQGTVADLTACAESVTGAYLSGRAEIPVPANRRPVAAPAVGDRSGTSRPGPLRKRPARRASK